MGKDEGDLKKLLGGRGSRTAQIRGAETWIRGDLKLRMGKIKKMRREDLRRDKGNPEIEISGVGAGSKPARARTA
jgi:hypothetical protein